jgi:hypothetical protein
MFQPLLRGAVLAATIGAIAAAAAALAENVDPSNAGAQYAWGENVGWINAEPAVSGTPIAQGVTVSGIGVTGFMYGENIGWINMSCQNNGTCAGTGNYGVKNDGAGNLSGYAWGENVGWISFACANNPSTCAGTGNYGVHINPATGEWTGAAWGENIGWINFSHNQTGSRVKSDDGDGIAGASDNCPFDANANQTNTDLANASVFPGADAHGDACDVDDDGDGCSDVEELSGNILLGGTRNPLFPWDFADVPTPALPAPGSKNTVITLQDVSATLAWVGRSTSNGTDAGGHNYQHDNNANGVPDGSEYDRVANGSLTGPPNGAITISDVGAVLGQVGTSCLAAPN